MMKQNPSSSTTFTLIILFLLMTCQALFLPVSAYANGGIKLHPPFEGTYRVTSYFDHDAPNYTDNNYIWIYNGEQRPANSQNDTPPSTGEPYPYDGHDGWDWSMVTGTDILAVAAGNVVVAEWGNWGGGYGRTIVISHNNGYYTVYSHLDQLLINLGDPVTAGQHIADSGATPTGTPAHLHFGVRQGGYINTTYAVDPFGWRGYGRDPLFDFNDKVSICLWRSHDDDPISCADTVVEDAAGGSVAFPAENWQVSNRGNGYHTFYRSNTAEQFDNHTWSTSAISNPLSPGGCQVYAFIPEDPDGTGAGLAFSEQVTYAIWTIDGWQTIQMSQNGHYNEWLFLGTFHIPGQTSVGMWAQTGEPAGAHWVMADGLKFRQYHNYLPLITRSHQHAQYAQSLLNNAPFIVNGAMTSSNDSGWLTQNENLRTNIVQPYGAGEYGIALGDAYTSLRDVYQIVTLPADARQATVSFWWWMASHEGQETGIDFLYLRIRDTSGNLLQTFDVASNQSPQGVWELEQYDLGAYAGRTIRVSFELSGNEWNSTSFWIDQVSLEVSE